LFSKEQSLCFERNPVSAARKNSQAKISFDLNYFLLTRTRPASQYRVDPMKRVRIAKPRCAFFSAP
jgi:hypothetical protein